jgi:hypothetical protein
VEGVVVYETLSSLRTRKLSLQVPSVKKNRYFNGLNAVNSIWRQAVKPLNDCGAIQNCQNNLNCARFANNYIRPC